MLETPIQANRMGIEYFTSGEASWEMKDVGDMVNEWLRKQPDDVVIYDVKYTVNSDGVVSADTSGETTDALFEKIDQLLEQVEEIN